MAATITSNHFPIKTMGLRDIGATLPPGFRFYPSDQELVCHYLYNKICIPENLKGTTLIEIDLHTCEPWQLPDVAKLNVTEWYFFSFRDRKYATGFRTNRATVTGYWKATGKDRMVCDPVTREIVGMRKTLVFYQNRAPNGIKTGWIMHEFRLESPHMPPKEDWVLCRVFHRAKSQDYNRFDTNNNLNDTLIHRLNPTSTFLNHGVVNDNAVASLQLRDSICHPASPSKVEDDYAFLWDDGNIAEERGLEYGSFVELGVEIPQQP